MATDGVQGRAVIIHLEHHLGPGENLVDHVTLEAAMTAQSAVVETGDILFLQTGVGHPHLSGATAQEKFALEGSDTALYDWILESGVAAIRAVNASVEAFPSPRRRAVQPENP